MELTAKEETKNEINLSVNDVTAQQTIDEGSNLQGTIELTVLPRQI